MKVLSRLSTVDDVQIVIPESFSRYFHGQKLNEMIRNDLFYIICYFNLVFIQQMINGFLNASIDTIEKRFRLAHWEAMLIPCIYEIATIIFVLPLTHFAFNSNKPRLVGIGAVIIAIGCFMFQMPHFMLGKYESTRPNRNTSDILCVLNLNRKENCTNSKQISSSAYRFILYFSLFIMGIGVTPFYTLGIVFMEENFPTSRSSLCIGITTALSFLGSVFGYFIQNVILLPSEELKPDNKETWIGAWWIGFLVSSILILLFGIPLTLFPNDGFATISTNEEKKTLNDEMANFVKAIKNLRLNTNYICMVIIGALMNFELCGFSIYASKYIKYQFDLSIKSSVITHSFIYGPILATSALVGTFWIKRYSYEIMNCVKFMGVTSYFSLPFILGFFINCSSELFVGINYPYNPETNYMGRIDFTTNSLNNYCNQNCSCIESEKYLIPNCLNKRITYYSPCFAGCKKSINQFYTECKCVDIYHKSKSSIVRNGLNSLNCKYKTCWLFYVFIVVLGFLFFLSQLRLVPNIIVTIRSVYYTELSVALGFKSFWERIIGGLGGPLLFGIFINNACIYWPKTCSGYGSCLKYSHNYLALSAITLFFLPSITILFCCFYQINPKVSI